MAQEDKKTVELIEELLKREDPALVGVKKILSHKKKHIGETTAYTTHTPEVFNQTTHDKSEENTTIFNDDEKDILELQKKIIELNDQIVEKEQLHQEALKESYEEGVEEGKRVQAELDSAEIETKIVEVTKEAENNLMELIQRDLIERENYFDSLKDDLLDLVFSIVRQIIKTEVSTNKEIIRNVVKRALFYVAEKNSIEIRVNPANKEEVESLINDLKSNGERYSSVSVIADESIGEGGSVIESPSGLIDATIERGISEMEQEVSRLWIETESTEQ